MSFILFYFLALFLASAITTTTPYVAATAAATVTVLESLDNQLPAVARVNIPYTWTFSSTTFFYSMDAPLKYTTSTLPAWLTFEPESLTFRGTPTINDIGYPEITVTAHATGSSTSSRFTVCVTEAPPPLVNLPISDQFHPNSPSLSSIFFLRPSSAIATQDPTVRVPREWSFSIGLESNTFVLPDGKDVYYELRLANGSGIPDFLTFNSKTVTLDGVVPSPDQVPEPLTLSFNLHASDQEGYTAATMPFTVVLADHELSRSNNSLPTINITSEANEFLVSFLSPADFTGVLVDGDNIQPSNISTLFVDVSKYGWLRYDLPSRTLSGTPGNITDPNPVLPVNLTTIFNQTIQTQVSLALVEPYFVLPNLPALNVSKGDDIDFTLSDWFSTTANPGFSEVTITASYSPVTVANFVRYNADTTKLTGTIPSSFQLQQSQSDHITITFTAYSHISHSTSHTDLDIYIPGTGSNLAPSYPSGLAVEAHRRLVLGLVITFGTIGGLCLLIGIFAIVRRCARVADTAVLGEEGRVAWSEKDRKWYGLTLSPTGTRVIERVDKVAFDPEPVSNQNRTPSPKTHANLPVPSPLGLGLCRVSERSQQDANGSDQPQHPHTAHYEVEVGGVMSKKEFLSRIKQTVRQVSDKYAARKQRTPPRVPHQGNNTTAQLVIGKPILVASTRPMAASMSDIGHDGGSPSNLGDHESMMPPSRPASTFLTGSPSGSTGEHSIPRRRPDFAPPRAQVHFGDNGLLVRQVSTGSMGGTSFQSGLSGEGESVVDMTMGPPTKPRLVPFTNSTRVPVPQATSSGAAHTGSAPQAGNGIAFTGNRIISQRAKVCKVDSQDGDVIIEDNGHGMVRGNVKRSSSNADELSMGIHYVRALGADQLTVQRVGGGGGGSNGGGAMMNMNGVSSPATSGLRSSFTSLESSNKSGNDHDGVMKVLLRAGERFKFRMPVPPLPLSINPSSGSSQKGYYVKLMSGQALPKFIVADLGGVVKKGVLELAGVPTFRDIGEMTVGVFAERDGTCVASVIIEVVGKR